MILTLIVVSIVAGTVRSNFVYPDFNQTNGLTVSFA